MGKVLSSKEIIEKIIETPQCAVHRQEGDVYCNAIQDAVKALQEGTAEWRALVYLAKNPGAYIVLDKGDQIVNRALRMAAERML